MQEKIVRFTNDEIDANEDMAFDRLLKEIQKREAEIGFNYVHT